MSLNAYGASLDSGGSPNGSGSLFSTSNFLRAINDSGTSRARYQIEWNSIERAVQTTSATAVGSAGSATITLAVVPANFIVGASVLVDASGSQQETVAITAQAGLTITATFAKTHSGTYPVAIIPTAGDTPSSSGSPARVAAYDWSVLDDMITACQSNGLFIDFVLQNAPVWHQTTLSIDASKPIAVAADAATFMTDLYAHLQSAFGAKNQFYSVEIANEGFNTGLLTSGNASSMFGQMFTLLNTVAPIIRSNSPNTLIGAPAELNQQTTNISAWTTGFFAANCHTLVDYVNFHFYPTADPDSPTAGLSGFQQWIASWQSAMTAAGSFLPIWVTEFGWTMGVVGDSNYNAYITTIFNDAVASGGVAAIFLYNLDSIVPALHFNDGSTNTTYRTWKNFIATHPTFTAPTKLTAYLSSAAAATIATANKLYSVAGSPSTNNNTTLLGAALNWGEIYAQGNVGAWAAAATQAGVPPSGHGFLWDVTTLELQDLLTGTYTVTLRLSTAGVGAVTITSDLHAVLYKYNAGTYTLIADCLLTAQSISTVFANYTLTFTVSGNTSFAIGDKLYLHLPAKVTANTGASTQTIRLGSLSTDTAGKTGSTNAQIVTPGFQPTPVIATSPTTLSFNALVGGVSPVSQNSILSETAGTPTSWTSSISYGSGSGWLAIAPTSGTLAALGTQAVAFTCTTGALAQGTYTATVTFTAANGKTATVNVTFVVSYLPGLSVLISGLPVVIKEGSWKLTGQVDQQDRCVFTVIDAAGTASFSKRQPVVVSDSVRGTLFTGYINKAKAQNLYPNAHRTWAIDCSDQMELPKKRTSNKVYANQFSGTIFADQIKRYLAGENVTGPFALDWDELQSDFAAGILTNTVVATNFHDANSGDGDLELSLAGVDVTYSDLGIISSATKCLKLQGTAVSGVTNSYVYRKIWTGSQLIASGDSLQYDVFISSTSPQIIAGVDFVCTDGTTFRDSPDAGTDAQGILPHPKNDLGGLANDQWYHRGFGVAGALIGKTISFVTVVLEGDNPGTYTAFFKNIYWKNGATTKQIFSDDSLYATSQLLGGPPTNSTVGLNGYNNVSLTIVQAYVNVINSGITHSIDAAKIVKSSSISWVTGNAGGRSGVATGASALLETSIDNGATWQTATNGGAIPNLLPGMSVAGRNIQFRRSVLLGNDPTVANYFVSEKLTVYTSYNATKSDVVSTTSSQANFNTGTFTDTKSLSGGGATLNGFTRNYDNADYSNQTVFGSSGPNQAVLNKQIYLISGPAVNDVKTRLDFAGQWQNFTAEVDLQVQANFTVGFVYRTTNWGNSNDSEAYTLVLSTSLMTFGKGNNSTGAGSNTNILTAPLSLTAGSWHRLKIIINGTTHQAYLDDVLYISTTDASYNFAMPNAGYIGLRMYNNSGSTQTAYFDNFGVTSNLTGTWQSPAISLAGATTYGSSLVEWDTLQTPDSTFITAQTSINGGSTWQDITNGGSIANLTPGQSLAGVNVIIKFTLTSNSTPVQPTLGAFTIWVLGQFSASGTRISPVLSLAGVGRAGSSLVNWNALQPTNTSVLVDTSIDNQVSWQNVASPGNAIAGINLQPQPTVDTFSTNTSANYTSTFWGTGSVGTWTWDTANSRIVGSGGTNAANLFNSVSFVDGITIFDMDYADSDAGIAFRWTDATHHYQLRINDASSGSNPNTARLFVKNGAGAATQIGSTAAITLARGTYKRFKLDVQGTTFTVYMDGVQILSVTDATLSASGKVALLAGTKIQCYQLRVQPYGDDVTSKMVYTRQRLNSTDPTATPAVLDTQTFVSSPAISGGVLVPSVSYVNTYVNNNLQDLNTKSNNWWNIDLNKKASCQPRNAVPAPWIVQSSDVLVQGLTLENSADLYRNRMVLTGVQDTQVFSKNFTGDGSSTSWTLDYPIATGTIPTISLNNQAQTVGVQGVDSGKQFYYTPGGTGITQDASGTVLAKDIDTLSVSYTGSVTVSVTRDNTSLPNTVTQAQMAAIDGSSGIVEMVEDVSSKNMNVAAAQAYGDQLLQRYGAIGRTLSFRTLRTGLAYGQQISAFVPEQACIDVQFLITTVEQTVTTGAGGVLQYWYSIVAMEGPNLMNWVKLFASGLSK
jgi:hypothetical protein